MDKLFLSEFMYITMPKCVSFLWGSLCSFVFKIFLFLEKYIDRMVDCDYKRKDSDFSKAFDEKGVEKERCVFVESKFQYISGENTFGFMEKPQVKSFTVQEMFVNFNEDLSLDHIIKEENEEISEEKLFHFSFFKDGNDEKAKGEAFDEKETNDDQEKEEDLVESEEILKQDEVFSDLEDICFEIQLLPKNEPFGRNSVIESDSTIGHEDFIKSNDGLLNSDYISCSDSPKLMSHLCWILQKYTTFEESGTHTQTFSESLSNIGDQFMEADIEENDDMGFIELETSLRNLSAIDDSDEFGFRNADRIEEKDVNCEEMKLMDDLQDFPNQYSSRKSWDTNVNGEEMKLMDDLQEFPDHDSSRKSWDTYVNGEEMKVTDDLQEFPDQESSRKSWDSTDYSDDEDEIDILLEHQNLVKQMKMEMKNSRIAGLPTISEDCESPKVVEDLKPLKIDGKIEYKDCIEEIQKFYKSYAEKMKKLDILNYQTLNAISFLQLKDTEVFMSSEKSSTSITKAFSLPSFRANKQRKIFADPAHKSISEMNRDLEFVYVGQICLSWEILCWQYGKAKELLEHDPHEYHSYNQVAGEFQQFQVLLQRFIEDEPFQGPRVQNYVRKRCMLRGFLQVPSIRDDRSKEKQGGHEGEKDVISIVKLAETIQETMQVFWEFLRADKREANLTLKGVQGTQMDTAEIELFMDIRSNLQKKERKLKDVQRSGNCIVKKFQKQQEGQLSHSLFTSLVELKLVSRVLNLPRLRRDHLVWCQKKLSNINVSGRKVSMEPSFSLFPC